MNMNTEHVEKITHAITEYDAIAAGLAALSDKYQGAIYDVTTRDGMNAAKEARAEIRAPRYRVEQIRKDAKRPILELGKMLDAEAKRITTEIHKIEDPIDAQIKAEEQRIKNEKQAKIAAEVARVEAIKERIKGLEGNQLLTPSSGSELIGQHISDLDGIVIDDSFAEFREAAERTKDGALDRLRALHAAAVEHEAEQARIEAERVEIERLRSEREKQNRIERQRIEAEREKQEAAAKAAREKLEADRLAQEEAARAETERLAAERAEVERLAAELEQRKSETAMPQDPVGIAVGAKKGRPSDDEIAAAVAHQWGVAVEVADEWLRDYAGGEA